jgi:hypothetical protein
MGPYYDDEPDCSPTMGFGSACPEATPSTGDQDRRENAFRAVYLNNVDFDEAIIRAKRLMEFITTGA